MPRRGPGKGRREQAPKRRNSRDGDEARNRGGAPRRIGTGRSRAEAPQRERGWTRLHDEDLEDAVTYERLKVGRDRVESRAEADGYGAKIEGPAAAGTVVEVQKGSFLTALDAPPDLPPNSAPLPGFLRTWPRGTMKHYETGLANLVAAGDRVEVIVPPVHGNEEYEGLLTKVEPRRSIFRRLHPSGRSIQTLAANVDRVAIVASTQEPPFRPGFVDRVLACAASCHLPAALVLNKIDLGVDAETEALLEVYRGLGVPVFRASALSGEGLDALRAAWTEGRTVLCGHSGVGKSSLLVALRPGLAEQVRVGEVSTVTSKGTHTTTHARLYRSAEGEIIDTPGVREFTPADTDRQNLWAWFPEIAARRDGCAFADCTHTVERGCAILAAVAAGEIHPRRHESYVRILKSLPE